LSGHCKISIQELSCKEDSLKENQFCFNQNQHTLLFKAEQLTQVSGGWCGFRAQKPDKDGSQCVTSSKSPNLYKHDFSTYVTWIKFLSLLPCLFKLLLNTKERSQANIYFRAHLIQFGRQCYSGPFSRYHLASGPSFTCSH